MPYSVYVLYLKTGHLYVGSTMDLKRRVADHKARRGSRTTAIAGVRELLYPEDYPSRGAAETRERQLKGWTRAKKLALARGDKSELFRLAKRRTLRP